MSTSKIRTTSVSGRHRSTIGPMVSIRTIRPTVKLASCLVFNAIHHLYLARFHKFLELCIILLSYLKNLLTYCEVLLDSLVNLRFVFNILRRSGIPGNLIDFLPECSIFLYELRLSPFVQIKPGDNIPHLHLNYFFVTYTLKGKRPWLGTCQ